jgi:hypothetical protein
MIPHIPIQVRIGSCEAGGVLAELATGGGVVPTGSVVLQRDNRVPVVSRVPKQRINGRRIGLNRLPLGTPAA